MIKQLTKKMLPESVDVIKLGDYIDLYTGVQFNKNDMEEEGTYPVINGGILPSGYTEQYNEPSETITISQGGASAGYVNYLKTPFWAGAHCFVLRPKSESVLLNRYLYHFVKQSELYLQQSQQGAGIPSVNRDKINALQIPLPPLSIQQEIVKILDTFTTLIEKMKQEVEKRKKQMEYYREQLLTFKDGECEWLQVQDVCKNICSGGTPNTKNKEFYKGEIPWLRTQEVDWNTIEDTDVHISNEAVRNSSAKLIPAYCVIIAMYGATAAKACINAIPLTTNQACCNLDIDAAKALYKYVYYFFCNEYEVLKAMGEGSQYNINGQKIKKYMIPIPSLEKQSSIVSTLDKFESYITKLEKMIELRQKQYEYYREQLLTFE